MMKRIFIGLAFLFVALSVSAIPARPKQFKNIKLSDGTTVVAQLVGDEFGHYWKTTDGRNFRKTKSGFELIDGKKVVEKAQNRRSAANQHRAKRQAQKAQPKLMTAQKVGQIGNYVGEKKGLIILVEYKDDYKFQPENNQALYNRIANEEGFNEGEFVGSVYDYFLAQSEGLFKLKFDVVGPYTLDNERAYYGGNNENDEDEHPAEMVGEACKKAVNDVDFKDYDWDGDGEVDQVFVLYAGNGEANYGDEDAVWPHEWTLSSAKYYYNDGPGRLKLDGVYIDTYACSNELQPAKFDRFYNVTKWKIDGIGTICHEFSHCLGYPDFYDTNYQNSGMGYWDLMDAGSYNGEGYRPAGFTSYERWVAGWKEPIELKEATEVTGMKSLQDGGDTYIIYNDGNRNEFYLLENRQWTNWDDEIPGKGLLILHVDYDEDAWYDNTVNDTKNHERMTWVAADNDKKNVEYDGAIYYDFDDMENDPYPYGKNNSFSNTSTPAATVFNKNTDGSKKLNKSVSEITQNSDGTISFKFEASGGSVNPGGDGDYKRISSTDDLKEDAEYLIVYEASDTEGTAYAGVDGSKNIGLKVDITIDGYTTSGASANPVKLKKADDGNWYILDGNDYLYFTGSKNSLFASSSITGTGFTWKISTTEIVNVDNNTRRLQYNKNANGLRFACYTGSQADVVLYMKVDDTTEIEKPTVSSEVSARGIFDLQGRKVSENAPLQRGIYIVNGKKFVVR